MIDVARSFEKLFADDTKIFKAIESMSDISIIQEDVNKLFEWSIKWQLSFDIGKCKAIHCGKDNPENEYSMNALPLSTDTWKRFRSHFRYLVKPQTTHRQYDSQSYQKWAFSNVPSRNLTFTVSNYCTNIWLDQYSNIVVQLMSSI